MSTLPQQFFASQKTSLDNFLAFQGAVFGCYEKIVALNLQAVKAGMDDMAEKSQQAIAVKDPQEALTLALGQAQPQAEKALAYGKHVFDIISAAQTDLSALTEEQFSQSQQQASAAIDELAKNAPAGSESAIALMKSSLATLSDTFDSVNKASRQAAVAAESGINAATQANFSAAGDAAASSKPARARRAA